MRRVRYCVAASLDGYLAGPRGEVDWIPQQPSAAFGSLYKQFDAVAVGRRTFELMAAAGQPTIPGMKTLVFSRTLRPQDAPGVVILGDEAMPTLAAMKARPGRDIWLFGGGSLFSSLAEAGLVDTVEVSLAPALLGGGVPLAPNLSKWIRLSLIKHTVDASGIISIEYAIR